MDKDAGREANRLRWDEAAPLHASSELYDLDGFRAGRNDIRPFELNEIGAVTGRALLHLQCHIGTDTLSWARHGANVVGLDFSAESIKIAEDLARDCSLAAEFVCSDVYQARAGLQGRQFDIVYTGIGALCWLPNLGQWAKVASELLAPNGVLYLVEIHPMVMAVVEDGRTITEHTLNSEVTEWDTPGGTYAAPEIAMANTKTFERTFSLSDVVTAVLDAGLVMEVLHEQDYTNVPWPWTERGEDGYYRLPKDRPRFPLTFSLRARKPG